MYCGVMKWSFVLAVAVYDVLFFWNNRDTASEWELNTLALWMFSNFGFLGIVALKSFGLFLGMILSMRYCFVGTIAVVVHAVVLCLLFLT